MCTKTDLVGGLNKIVGEDPTKWDSFGGLDQLQAVRNTYMVDRSVVPNPSSVLHKTICDNKELT